MFFLCVKDPRGPKMPFSTDPSLSTIGQRGSQCEAPGFMWMQLLQDTFPPTHCLGAKGHLQNTKIEPLFSVVLAWTTEIGFSSPWTKDATTSGLVN